MKQKNLSIIIVIIFSSVQKKLYHKICLKPNETILDQRKP